MNTTSKSEDRIPTWKVLEPTTILLQEVHRAINTSLQQQQESEEGETKAAAEVISQETVNSILHFTRCIKFPESVLRPLCATLKPERQQQEPPSTITKADYLTLSSIKTTNDGVVEMQLVPGCTMSLLFYTFSGFHIKYNISSKLLFFYGVLPGSSGEEVVHFAARGTNQVRLRPVSLPVIESELRFLYKQLPEVPDRLLRKYPNGINEQCSSIFCNVLSSNNLELSPQARTVNRATIVHMNTGYLVKTSFGKSRMHVKVQSLKPPPIETTTTAVVPPTADSLAFSCAPYSSKSNDNLVLTLNNVTWQFLFSKVQPEMLQYYGFPSTKQLKKHGYGLKYFVEDMTFVLSNNDITMPTIKLDLRTQQVLIGKRGSEGTFKLAKTVDQQSLFHDPPSTATQTLPYKDLTLIAV